MLKHNQSPPSLIPSSTSILDSSRHTCFAMSFGFVLCYVCSLCLIHIFVFSLKSTWKRTPNENWTPRLCSNVTSVAKSVRARSVWGYTSEHISSSGVSPATKSSKIRLVYIELWMFTKTESDCCTCSDSVSLKKKKEHTLSTRKAIKKKKEKTITVKKKRKKTRSRQRKRFLLYFLTSWSQTFILLPEHLF